MKRFIPLFILVACGGPAPIRSANGTRATGGTNVDGTPTYVPWSDWKGGTYSATACPRADTIAGLRCPADNSPRVALSVCGDVAADNTLTVLSGDSSITGNIRVASPAHFGGNAVVAGTLTADNTVDVSGVLSVGARTGSASVTAQDVREGSIAPIVACNVPPISVVSVDEFRNQPDQSLPPDLAPSNLLAKISEPSDITLGCGRYLFSNIDAGNTLDIHIVGDTVLVIEGDVKIASPTRILLADGASLELVIGGTLAGDNTFSVGDSAHPAYVAVAGSVRVASPMNIYGAFVTGAPVAGDNTLDVWGSAFIGGPLRVASPMTVHSTPTLDTRGCTTF